MNIASEKWAVAITASLIAACGAKEPQIDLEAYTADVLDWRKGRLERLQGPDGYLNLAGLYWLKAGSSRFGSAADNDVVFPAYAAPYIGVLQTSGEGVELLAEPGVDVRHQDKPINSIVISDDTTDNPVTITHRSYAWTVVKRDDRFALRLRRF